MSAAATTLITADDYRQLPEGGPRFQLIQGELYMAPAPNRYHQDISRNIGLIVGSYLKNHLIGVLYYAPFDVYLSDHDVFQPDLVFISRANRSILTDEGAQGAPDWVVEILSAKTVRLDRQAKRRIHARSGVKELWLVEPQSEQIEIYLLAEDENSPRQVVTKTAEFTSPMFPGLIFKASDIFHQPLSAGSPKG